jgi:alanyl-tRNA synthetase
MTSVNQIREAFLAYFEKHGHTRRASAPLVPQNDPTPSVRQCRHGAVQEHFHRRRDAGLPACGDSQKCVRAGGKHNDLDNVGYTARHHTFLRDAGEFLLRRLFQG